MADDAERISDACRISVPIRGLPASVLAEYEQTIARISRAAMDHADAQIRTRLIAAGWTPPGAPQPATTDDAVERAARALAARDRTEWSEPIPWDHWVTAAQDRFREDARAALAAAGAGAEVDREARVRDVLADLLADSHDHPDLDEMTAAVLAARGDAATPGVTTADFEEAVIEWSRSRMLWRDTGEVTP